MLLETTYFEFYCLLSSLLAPVTMHSQFQQHKTIQAAKQPYKHQQPRPYQISEPKMLRTSTHSRRGAAKLTLVFKTAKYWTVYG